MPATKSPQTLGAVRVWEPYRHSAGLKGLPDYSTIGTGHGWLGSTKSAFIANGYLALPGTSGNYASAPDSAAVSITGNIDIRCKAALDDWTPAADQMLVAKFSAAGLRSYRFYVANGGSLVFQLSADGTALVAATSSVLTGVADGAVKWARATWRASDGRVQFFLSDNGTAWTQLGTDQSVVVASIHDNASVLEVGSRVAGTADPLLGRVYRAQVRNNILDDGTGIQFDADFSTLPVGTTSFVESSSNAATVTINSSAADTNDPVYTLTGTNLLAASENLDWANWTQSGSKGINVTGITPPTGITYVTKLEAQTTSNSESILQGVTASAQRYTASIYVRAGSVSRFSIGLNNAGFQTVAASIESGPGAISGTGLVTVLSLTSSWTRVVFTLTGNAPVGTLNLHIYPGNTGAQTAGDYVYVTGAQLEAATSASTYTPSNAASLDFSTDDYVQAPDATDLAFGAAMTVFGVVKIATPGATAAIVDQYDTNAARAFAAFATTGGKLRAILSADGGSTNVKDYTGSQTFADNTWRSFAITYAAGTTTLYVNALADGSPTKTTDNTVASLFNTTANLMIGASLATAAAANNLTGSEAAIALFPTALSADDVASLHNYYQGVLAADGITLSVVGNSSIGAIFLNKAFGLGG